MLRLQVQYTDILWQVTSLLAAPALQDGFMTTSDVADDEGGGGRKYGELNRGLWWERTEKSGEVPNGVTLCPLICYTDGTWLSKSGTHNIQPLVVTIGNFPRRVMNKHAAKQVNSREFREIKA